MKKLFLSAALVATIMMVSCSAEKKAEDEGASLKAKIENCSDPDSLKIYVRQAKDYADKLISEGKDSAAETFLGEVTPAVRAKDPAAALGLTALDIKAKADSTFEATKESAKELADSTSKAVSDKVSDAKEAISNAAEQTKEKAAAAAESAKKKTAEAAQAGADKVKDLMGQ
ncbi:MAG: hypothetical protein K2F88_07725 [Duncaniella sp.]|uniref:hypothetical protein n=1 Tax=Duncaniella sp. TaxID=2518496 RepID=UPI0023C97378|nr:hypothetical protein [Duncaniella sp.]MDE5987848.1 hypothetical protein [Duncaniella sp.]MDE6175434.1 hypothetical protein [Duncaniella sp.]